MFYLHHPSVEGGTITYHPYHVPRLMRWLSLPGSTGWSLAIAEADAPCIGQIGLWSGKRESASLGYWVLSSARGKGAAARALATLSRFGLAQFARLELYVEPWNEASWRTAERVSYRREGLMRSFQEIGGERKGLYLYSLLPGELRS